MKNKKRTFFVVMAIILTAGIYYFYSRRDKGVTSTGGGTSTAGDGKLYQYSWIGCNSCPDENVTPEMLASQKSGFAGINIANFNASGNVSVGDKVQIVTNMGSDVEGTYNVIGIGAGCMRGGNGYPNLIVIDLVWNCGSHPSPSSADGGVLRILKS